MDKIIYEDLEFLVNTYNCEYKFQTFDIGGGWIIHAHSFYNASGCFTVHSMETRGELYFYYSKNFSTDNEVLYEKIIDIYTIEKEIWDKYGKIGFIPNVFFWWSNKRIMKAVAEVIQTLINKNGEFFGIKV